MKYDNENTSQGMEEEDDVLDNFENSPDGELKQMTQEENASDDDFDYQQGFSSANYPEQANKDSITKFYRGIIGLMTPKKIVRVGNLTNREKKNCKRFLNYADYNQREGNDLIADALRDMTVVEAACSMGHKGFIVTNMMTQRRVVSRETNKTAQPTSNWSNGKSVAGGQK